MGSWVASGVPAFGEEVSQDISTCFSDCTGAFLKAELDPSIFKTLTSLYCTLQAAWDQFAGEAAREEGWCRRDIKGVGGEEFSDQPKD